MRREERTYPPDTLEPPASCYRKSLMSTQCLNREEAQKCPVNWIQSKEFKVQIRRQNDKNNHKTEVKN